MLSDLAPCAEGIQHGLGCGMDTGRFSSIAVCIVIAGSWSAEYATS
eukprot:COSAG01_NODE_3176_length_6464_cov_54.777219_3_plen_46_part_00